MKIDTQILRGIVDSATPGPWIASSHGEPALGHGNPWEVFKGDDDCGRPVAVCPRANTVYDAHFIATFSPEMCRSLLDEIDHLRAAR